MTLTKELEASLRIAIDPIYVGTPGTESHERAALLGEIDRLRAMTQWQDIASAPKDKWVIVNNGGIVEVARLYSTGRWLNVAEYESSLVNHWMPMPEAPKTEDL